MITTWQWSTHYVCYAGWQWCDILPQFVLQGSTTRDTGRGHYVFIVPIKDQCVFASIVQGLKKRTSTKVSSSFFQ